MSQVFDILKPISGTTKLSQLYQIIRDHDQAIRSSFSGAVAPATPVAGQLWEDTANDKLFIYTSAGAWAEVAVANIGLGLEIIASRGSHTSLDARLDAQLNEDGTLKAATTLNPSQWYDLTIASGYVSTTSFKAKGADYTTVYYATRRLKINQAGGAYYTEVASSSYGAPDTTVVTRDAVVGANAAAFRYASHSIVGPRRASFGDGAVSYAMIGNKTVASPVGTYTVLVGDDIVLANGTFTVTGPIAALFGAGRSLIVINIGAGNITYDAYSSETINGSASPFILYPDQSLCMTCDGSNWKRFDQPNSLSVPTITSFANAPHTHAASGATGGTITNITGAAATATTATTATTAGTCTGNAATATTLTTGAQTISTVLRGTPTVGTSTDDTGNNNFRVFGTLRVDGEPSAFQDHWTYLSDERAKKNIKDYTLGLNEIIRFQPKSFEYNGQFETPVGLRSVGLVAQDVAKIIPEAVNKKMVKQHKTDVEEKEVLELGAGLNMHSMFINAIKELNQRLEKLEGKK